MDGTPANLDTILDLCSDHHRRIVLAVLLHEGRSLTVNDVTKTIARRSHHASIVDVSEEELKGVRLSLLHTHLPKLAERSLVAYDPERQLVEPTAELEALAPQLSAVLETDPDIERPAAL